ncbi:MAG: ABC transporter permease [Phycisphaerales bacterium]|nr:ABC transporter permease [Phycisphaerales bacterium]
MILTQTKAIFLDAYRELNAKKLFWLTMGLTVLFAALLAVVGIDEEGVRFLWFNLSFIPIDSSIIEPKEFYISVFSYLGISLWLTWIATILAIISTAGIIPELVTGGTIESMLSRPISRTRLFLTKYATGLLFVALQVAVFSVLSMLIIWINSGYLELRILMAIPIVVSFFSFLFCVCAFIGLITRSTMTAMLLTLLFWSFLFILNMADGALMQFQESTAIKVEQRTQRVELARENTTKLILRDRENEGLTTDSYIPSEEEIQTKNPLLKGLENKLAKDQVNFNSLNFWTKIVFATKTFLPKTGETIELLNRELIAPDEYVPDPNSQSNPTDLYSDIKVDQKELRNRLDTRYRERSIFWILGTSFIFEFLILGLSTIIFSRRDF